MKKDNLKSIIVLSVICLVTAVTMAAVNFVTAPKIKENEDKKVQESLLSVMPDAEGFEEIPLSDSSPETVVGVYRETSGKGYAVALATESSYSSNPMAFTVAISSEGKIIDIKLTGYSETKDFGRDTYPLTYIGADSDSVMSVDLKSGVTYSSTAFRSAVADAFAVLDLKGGAE